MINTRCFIFVTAFVGTIAVLTTACNNKKTSSAIHSLPVKDTAELQIKTTSSYDSLRKVALSTTADMLQLKLPITDTVVYGIVMDWETNGGIVTIVSFANGDAGSYGSAGDEITGGKGHPGVIKVAKEFVKKAQQYLSRTQKVTDLPLPSKKTVIFYLLTTKGIFKGTEGMEKIDADTSEWQDLFDKGNEVSAELRFLKDQHP